MADKAPLLFAKRLGGLFPVNPQAEQALQAITPDSPVKIDIKRTRGNQGRLALYWIVLGKVAPALSDLCEGDAITDTMLHRILKERRGLFSETVLPSGQVWRDYDSISFKAMTENERAEYIDWAFSTLAKWLGVPVVALTEDERKTA